MKRIIIVLAFLVSNNFVMAQQESHVPVYWVVETNVYQKDFTILKFYNGQNQLIHEVTLDRSFLDISKGRHKRKVEALFKKYRATGLTSSKKHKQRKSI
jgi:hypothetical protein